MDAIYFDGFPYDGPFQTLYPLRRIDTGSYPGRDFYFFHGNGLPYLHYPIYKLFGSNIFSSELSALIVQFITSVIGVAAFLWFAVGWRVALLGTSIYFLVGVYGNPFVSLSPFNAVSTFSARTLMPLLLAAMLLFWWMDINRTKDYVWRAKITALAALACVIGVLLGTEQGFYMAAAWMVIVMWPDSLRSVSVRMIDAATFIVTFTICLIGIHFLLFGNLTGLVGLRNLVVDQVWYFGTYPQAFISEASEILFSDRPSIKFMRWMLVSSMAVLAFVITLRNHRVITQRIFKASLFLLAYGLVSLSSSMAISAWHYNEPLARALLLISGVCAVLGILKYKSKMNANKDNVTNQTDSLYEKYKVNGGARIGNTEIIVIGWLTCVFLIMAIILVGIKIENSEIKRSLTAYGEKKIGGVYLARERGHWFRSSYAHGQVVDKWKRLTTGDELDRNVDKWPGADEIKVDLVTDSVFGGGIERITTLYVPGVEPSRDAWMIGAIAWIKLEVEASAGRSVEKGSSELENRALLKGGGLDECGTGYGWFGGKIISKGDRIGAIVTNISVDQITIDRLLPGGGIIPIDILIEEKPRTLADRTIRVSSVSDTLQWQGGIWTGTDKARVLLEQPEDAFRIRPGSFLTFSNSGKRKVESVSCDMVTVEGSALIPYKDGSPKLIRYSEIRSGRGTEEFDIRRKRLDVVIDADKEGYWRGRVRGQRVLIQNSNVKIMRKGDFVVGADGKLREIMDVDGSIISLDQGTAERYRLGAKSCSSKVSASLNRSSYCDKGFWMSQLGQTLNKQLDYPLATRWRQTISGEVTLRYVPRNWDSALNKKEKTKGLNKAEYHSFYDKSIDNIWSIYSGMLDYVSGKLNPSGEDYIIHVLGDDEREKYITSMDRVRPKIVQLSIANLDLSDFHMWLLNTSWPFFERILNNYDPALITDYSVLWRRESDESWIEPGEEWINIGSNFPVSVPIDDTRHAGQCSLRVGVLKVGYQQHNPLSFLPILGKTARFMLFKKDVINTLPAPLPPHLKAWEVPILWVEGESPSIDLETISPFIPSASIEIREILFKELDVPNRRLQALFLPRYAQGDDWKCSKQMAQLHN